MSQPKTSSESLQACDSTSIGPSCTSNGSRKFPSMFRSTTSKRGFCRKDTRPARIFAWVKNEEGGVGLSIGSFLVQLGSHASKCGKEFSRIFLGFLWHCDSAQSEA